jgi:hypothetical protein
MTTEKPHLADGVTIRRLTDPEAGCHWFGYYDKFETSPDDRYVLACGSASSGGGRRATIRSRSP